MLVLTVRVTVGVTVRVIVRVIPMGNLGMVRVKTKLP